MPYEKRILDVIKTGGSGAEKKVRLVEGEACEDEDDADRGGERGLLLL